ncbi:MAG: polyprenol monophosphomannose synthase [Egibacteraceae bacterium]
MLKWTDEAVRRQMTLRPEPPPPPWSEVRLTVVVPTYNEADNLPGIVEALFTLPLPNLRVLIVDDGSPDGTGLLAEELASRYNDRVQSRMAVLHRPRKAGLGRAYVAGMTRALREGAQFVAQMDADFSHSPCYVPRMLGVLLSTGAGVAIGSRYVEGGTLDRDWSWWRRILSWWANLYARTILRMRVRDITAGFKIWQADVLREIGLENIDSDGYVFQIEMNYLCKKLGHDIVEVPIDFRERRSGSSKMGMGVKVEAALRPLQLRLRHRHVRGNAADEP